MDNLKQLWIDKLRSDEYKQGIGHLRVLTPRGDRFCCLGVLCDIVDKTKWRDNLNPNSITKIWDNCVSLLPKNIKIINKQGTFHTPEILMQMNDKQIPFNKIADYIEKNVEKVEVVNVTT